MEKMPLGFASEFDDWRYEKIMLNSKLFGITGGDSNRTVDVCGECHLQVVEGDHLFELPREFLRH